jgi:hypothetical protein
MDGSTLPGYTTLEPSTPGSAIFWLRLSDMYRMANLPEILVDYRVHSQQVSQNTFESNAERPTRCDSRRAGKFPLDIGSPLP